MGHLTRQPTSNEPEKESWKYGPQPPLDDWAARLNGMAKLCMDCKRCTLNKFLSVMGLCPECSPVKRNL